MACCPSAAQQHGAVGLKAEIKAAISWLHHSSILSPHIQKSGKSLPLQFAERYQWMFLHCFLPVLLSTQNIELWNMKGKRCKCPASGPSSHLSPNSNMPCRRKQRKAGSMPAASASCTSQSLAEIGVMKQLFHHPSAGAARLPLKSSALS